MHDSGFMLRFPDFAAFLERRHVLLGAYSHMRDPRRPDLLVPQEIPEDVVFPVVREELAEMAWELREVAALIGWHRMIGRFRRAKRVVLVGGFMAAMSILVLTWAANPPPRTSDASFLTIGTPEALP